METNLPAEKIWEGFYDRLEKQAGAKRVLGLAGLGVAGGLGVSAAAVPGGVGSVRLNLDAKRQARHQKRYWQDIKDNPAIVLKQKKYGLPEMVKSVQTNAEVRKAKYKAGRAVESVKSEGYKLFDKAKDTDWSSKWKSLKDKATK
jgi:hypothetical protein